MRNEMKVLGAAAIAVGLGGCANEEKADIEPKTETAMVEVPAGTMDGEPDVVAQLIMEEISAGTETAILMVAPDANTTIAGEYGNCDLPGKPTHLFISEGVLQGWSPGHPGGYAMQAKTARVCLNEETQAFRETIVTSGSDRAQYKALRDLFRETLGRAGYVVPAAEPWKTPEAIAEAKAKGMAIED